MSKIILEDVKRPLKIVSSFILIGRFTLTRKWFFFKRVFVVQNFKPLLEYGIPAEFLTFEKLEEALIVYEGLRR